jgi:hypothetical protein
MHERTAAPQNVPATVPGGILIAAALLAVLALAHHPVVESHGATGVMRQIVTLSAADRVVHGVVIAAMLLVLFAFCTFAQRRDLRRPANLFALLAYAVGAAAIVVAGLVDGFFVPEIALHFGGPADAVTGVGLLKLCAIAIQLFTKLGVIAMAVAAVAWSADLVRGTAAQRVVAAVGFAAVAAQAAVLAFGGPSITVHTVLIIVAAQACWYVAAGILLIRGDV